VEYNTVEVLLVEDSPVDAELVLRELKRNHIANQVVHMDNGEDALDFLFGRGKYRDIRDIRVVPKLILMDIKMPKLTGIELVQAIKSHEETRTIPIVILTSSREDPDIRQCYALGVNSYIVKPVNFIGFAEAIKNLGMYWLLLNQPPVK
jgi:CheY-like chemotaxis protein